MVFLVLISLQKFHSIFCLLILLQKLKKTLVAMKVSRWLHALVELIYLCNLFYSRVLHENGLPYFTVFSQVAINSRNEHGTIILSFTASKVVYLCFKMLVHMKFISYFLYTILSFRKSHPGNIFLRMCHPIRKSLSALAMMVVIAKENLWSLVLILVWYERP